MHMGCKVLKVGVAGGTMPVLHTLGNVDDIAGMEADGRFAPLLVDAFAADADEHLVDAVVDVPVVATARLEGDVGVGLCGLSTGC